MTSHHKVPRPELFPKGPRDNCPISTTSFLEDIMLPQVASAPQLPSRPCTRIGVGIDTSRYGHYAAFLRQDLNAAAAELQFVESAAGYTQLRQRLEDIRARRG